MVLFQALELSPPDHTINLEPILGFVFTCVFIGVVLYLISKINLND